MLSLPMAALAVVAVLLSMNLGSTTPKASASVNNGMEYTLHVGGCNTAADAKGNCVVALGGTFVATVSLDAITGIGGSAYDALAVTVGYTGLSSKDNPSMGPEWADCGIEATNVNPGVSVNAGCSTGVSAPSSTYLGTVFSASFNCTADGTLTIIHSDSESLLIDKNGITQHEDGPDVLNIDCQPAPTATPVPPTATPPAIPRVFKAPVLQNIFLHRQGAKIPPSRCDDGTDVGTLTEQIGGPVASISPKGELQTLAAFEFEVRFDPSKVCVNLVPSAEVAGNINFICTVRDKDSSTLEGIAQIGCVSVGKGHSLTGLILATIEVRPQPELYSQLRPNQDNGQVVQILNQGCELADEQGHAIPIFSCEDADITFRYLEGDVDGPDCDVDVFDSQAVAFRWGVNKGSLLYNSFMDLEPSGQVKGDGDIDIKDIQFVFGRFGSTCANPHPAQPPVNSKA
jgi:hypothetical protein